MWNLNFKKWCKLSYLQSRIRVTDIENKLTLIMGGKEVEGKMGRFILT